MGVAEIESETKDGVGTKGLKVLKVLTPYPGLADGQPPMNDTASKCALTNSGAVVRRRPSFCHNISCTRYIFCDYTTRDGRINRPNAVMWTGEGRRLNAGNALT